MIKDLSLLVFGGCFLLKVALGRDYAEACRKSFMKTDRIAFGLDEENKHRIVVRSFLERQNRVPSQHCIHSELLNRLRMVVV